MPQSGGVPSSSASSSGVTNATADDHFSYVRWDDAVLPALATVTPSSPGEKTESPEQVLERTLKVSKWNPSLTLLYFHTPHEGLEKSKLVGAAGATFRQCKTFHNEKVVQWLQLYHCVEVDMAGSDLATAERLGFKDGAIFSVVDQDLNVVATSKPLAESEGVAKYLETTMKSEKAAKHWAIVQARIEEQRKSLEKARELAKAQMWKESLEQYQLVLNAGVQVADFWDAARKESVKVARKAEQAK